jgi:catechol 2,3-dioxygenase-like lactoylglutathione lyase family enzyme
MDLSHIEFGRAAPTIAVTSLEKALPFYVGALGMAKVFENGDPAGFVILKRDSAEIHLTVSSRHVAASHNVAHLLVSDAAALYDRCVESGAHVIKRLRDQPYGLRDFVVADPDGNRIDIGQRL